MAETQQIAFNSTQARCMGLSSMDAAPQRVHRQCPCQHDDLVLELP